MTEISDEFLFYYHQYQIASKFSDYTDCSDLKTEFENLMFQYKQNKDETIYQKIEENIKSFYKRGLPEWFRFLNDEMKKSEGKYYDYFDERESLLNIRKKFDQNNLDLFDYTNLVTDFKKLDSKVKIRKSMEKFQTNQTWKYLLFSVIIGFVLGLAGSILLKMWNFC